MGDMMYTIDRIENDIVVLENRKTLEIIEVYKNLLPNNIKEGDILDFIDGKYYINDIITKNNKDSIRSRFDSLKK